MLGIHFPREMFSAPLRLGIFSIIFMTSGFPDYDAKRLVE